MDRRSRYIGTGTGTRYTCKKFMLLQYLVMMVWLSWEMDRRSRYTGTGTGTRYSCKWFMFLPGDDGVT